MSRNQDEQFSEEEAQRRFMAALKVAVNTPPKPLKSMAPKGVAAQSRKRREMVKRRAAANASGAS